MPDCYLRAAISASQAEVVSKTNRRCGQDDTTPGRSATAATARYHRAMRPPARPESATSCAGRRTQFACTITDFAPRSLGRCEAGATTEKSGRNQGQSRSAPARWCRHSSRGGEQRVSSRRARGQDEERGDELEQLASICIACPNYGLSLLARRCQRVGSHRHRTGQSPATLGRLSSRRSVAAGRLKSLPTHRTSNSHRVIRATHFSAGPTKAPVFWISSTGRR